MLGWLPNPKFSPMSDWHSRITIEPGKLGGKPCVRGMRMSVADVLEYLAADMSIEEILADFPYLEREDILACLAYAAERERERGSAPQPSVSGSSDCCPVPKGSASSPIA